MKKVIFIGIILLLSGLIIFTKPIVEDDFNYDFLEIYRTELQFVDLKAEKVYSTDNSENGLRITFVDCLIDSTNIKDISTLSTKIANQIHHELNTESKYENIILVFVPKNPEGIQIDDMFSIKELKFSHKSSDLKN